MSTVCGVKWLLSLQLAANQGSGQVPSGALITQRSLVWIAPLPANRYEVKPVTPKKPTGKKDTKSLQFRVRPTLKDIAAYAGVSYSTVARILSKNGKYSVSKEMREHVLDVARKYGYSTNPFARYMRNNRSHIIGISGVVMHMPSERPSSDRIELNRRVRGINSSFYAKDYNLMLLLRDEQDPDLESRLIEGTAYLDGLIYVSPTVKHKALLMRLSRRLPIVLEDTHGLMDICSVSVDQYSAVDSASRLLLNRGCRRLGIITHHGGEYYHNQVRLKAFKETIQKFSLTVDADQIASCCGRQSSRAAALRLLQGKKRVDGIIAPRDEELLGVLDAIEESNLVLGKDVRLISINETEVSRHMKPGISVIRFPAELVAREAFELLIRLIQGQVQSPEHILLPATIVERQSTTG